MEVRTFKAIRPAPDSVSRVTCLPYDVYSEKEARERAGDNPDSFLRVVRPEISFPEGTDPSSTEVYEKAGALIDEALKKGTMVSDGDDAFYIYREIMNGRAQTGLVSCFACEDYMRGNIKQHELTRYDKEVDRKRHILACGANTGLVFLAYNDPKESAKNVISDCIKGKPLYDYISEDGVTQQVWKIADKESVSKIKKAFSQVDTMYITDGHHRSAAASLVCREMRSEHPDFTGDEEFNYFLAVAFEKDDLLVMPYYRVVKDLNGMSEDEFLSKLSERFEVEIKNLPDYEPKHAGEVAMYLGGIWYKLTAKPEIVKTDSIGSLDVSLMQENIFAPILGITDPRKSDRIDFVGGIKGLKGLEKRCSEDMVAAFATRHTTIEQLMRVADDGEIMPPKSTWFEPKLQSGLFVHKITDR